MGNIRLPKLTPDSQKMYELAEHYSEASQYLDEQSKSGGALRAGSKVLVDSFAVELYLKYLFVLDKSSRPPKEHNFEKLFTSLTDHTQNSIRNAFNNIVDSDHVLSNLNVINPEAFKIGFTDFDCSLEVAKNTFAHRRYLYEEQSMEHWFYTNLLREAIRSIVKQWIQTKK